LEFGLIGLAQSGKTTVFDTLTEGRVPTGAYESGAPHMGVIKVPDERLDRLAERFQPKKATHADARFLDFPGAVFARGFGRGGSAAEAMTALGSTDALVHVVRAFRSEHVPHAEGTVDAHRDIATMDMELGFADLAFLEKRLERLGIAVRSARAGEREQGEKELALLRRLKEALEAETPLREQRLSPDEMRAIENYDLLTAKPQLLLLNIDEADVCRVDELVGEFGLRWGGPGREVVWLCAELEMELSELSPEEAAEMRTSYGLTEAGRERVIRACSDLLGLVSFFTVNPEEAHAWTVPRGTAAVHAAGKVHSDMERGFIRAEVLAWQELLEHGSMAEARKRGVLRIEGKEYQVEDGDVLHILFSV
jgi:hypothetical protein